MRGERARLTVLYGGLLVLAGALLTGLVYLLLSNTLYGTTFDAAVIAAVPTTGHQEPTGSSDGLKPTAPLPGTNAPTSQGQTAPQGFAKHQTIEIQKITTVVNQAALRRLLTVSGLSLAVFAAGSAALAWWMAGRVLSPVGAITTRARLLSASNLHERLALRAPPGASPPVRDRSRQHRHSGVS